MLGRKTGAGFYEWEGKKALRERAVYPQEELDALAADLLAPMIDKCRTAVEDGIVASADDADIGCILGIGFPRYRGGPLGWADYPR
jgi:3-hydroxyacyl-CoA dehydrogenase